MSAMSPSFLCYCFSFERDGECATDDAVSKLPLYATTRQTAWRSRESRCEILLRLLFQLVPIRSSNDVGEPKRGCRAVFRSTEACDDQQAARPLKVTELMSNFLRAHCCQEVDEARLFKG